MGKTASVHPYLAGHQAGRPVGYWRETRAPEEVYVSTELIGIIAASIALGTALLASMRGLRQEMRDMRTELREEIRAGDAGLREEIRAGDGALREEIKASNRSLREEIKAGDGALREEIKAGDGALREEIKAGDGALREEIKASNRSLREEIKAGDSALRAEMRAGFKEQSVRMVDIGDRLSKIEGIIEGMFWSSRNQPPDKPREGAA